MHLNALTCAAILGYFSVQVAAGPVADDNNLAGYARQAHAVDNVAEPTFKKAKRVIPDTHVLHERQALTWASQWQKVERAAPDAILPMRIGLKQRNVDEGHDRLMALSDPKSPDYGKHMSAKEVIDFFAPDRTSVDAVVNWLTSAGIHVDRITQSANKQWIQFDATAAEAEELLKTEYHFFEHTTSGDIDLGADDYHVPNDVKDHIDYVTPGIRLRQDLGKNQKKQHVEKLKREVRRTLTTRSLDKGEAAVGIADAFISLKPKNTTVCATYASPECMRYVYGIPLGTTATPGNELGIYESLGDHYSKIDLDVFMNEFAPFVPNGTYPIPRLIDGSYAETKEIWAGEEANLDFMTAIPLIYPQQTVLFQTDNDRSSLNASYKGMFNTFFDGIDGSYCSFEAFGEKGNCVTPECLDPIYPNPSGGGYQGSLQCGVFQPTNVITISYSYSEVDMPESYVKRQCLEVMKLGLQGVTVVMASGDYGIGSFYDDGGNPDGCGGSNGTIFMPQALAVCPYVLAVGSTVFKLKEPITTCKKPKYYDMATQWFSSGGGFSNYFPTPNWQVQAVRDYFEHTDVPFKGYQNMGNSNFSEAGDGVYHIGGRGYPDVSAIGDDFIIALEGSWHLLSGTSISTVVWGSVLTLINEHRLKNGMKTLGFVTPALYAYPQVMNDVTLGDNERCHMPGFTASKGWDPVSGLGTPNYPKLLELFMHFTNSG
ncbi:hypothetical protein SEPCBS119000_000905 [Sporothrix epigloea]|uniref:Peptidase S53 domain-containing protein n=1 Tax=Sporothrix epigloea TaxID=1892477 RepID=A0ABP0D7U1_9PEZI